MGPPYTERLTRFRRDGLRRLVFVCVMLGASWLLPSSAGAFRVIGSPSAGWARWDAAPRYVGGEERSLSGGLRYSVETGSYAGLRDQFIWFPEVPTEQAFAGAVRRAFEHWTVVDEVTGLPAAFYFVEDLSTAAVDVFAVSGLMTSWTGPNERAEVGLFFGLNAGAEVDLFAETPHAGSGFGGSVVFFVDPAPGGLMLSSGRPGYSGRAISGADIRINPRFQWTLSGFEILLTHEIGHVLGFADLEASVEGSLVSAFLDDDYDPNSSAQAGATLTNPFALAVDPYDPDGSGLSSHAGSMGSDPGLSSLGVELLMESDGFFDLTHATQKLQNDEIAGRQFLYPVALPEPGVGLMLAVGAATLSWCAERRAR